jgi:CheY-like chemotaxis protein
MNLSANAAEAMPAGGRMVLRARRVLLEAPLHGHECVPPGEYVHLQLADEGVGIAEGDLKRIFEPFFTKKQMGRSGTGLGMTVIWATVKDHHGFIDVTSREGAGTRFDLYFPASHEALVDAPRPTALEDYLGSERLLVVDDLDDQRTITASMLRKLGYQVDTAASGQEALACLAARPADLVILDMLLGPAADGLMAYQQMVAANPRQKAILVSASTTLERVRAAQTLGAGEFVPKPFTLEAIGLAVRRELERPARPTRG